MSQSHIRIRGARTHNLKNVSLDIPRDKFVVITGLSGSGKSSLALIPCMPKVSAVMSSHCRPMRVSFYPRWKNRKLMQLKACLLQSQLNRSQPVIIHVLQWELLQKFMTICDCFTPV